MVSFCLLKICGCLFLQEPRFFRLAIFLSHLQVCENFILQNSFASMQQKQLPDAEVLVLLTIGHVCDCVYWEMCHIDVHFKAIPPFCSAQLFCA